MKYILAGDTFETSYYPVGRENYTIVNELVSFVPAKNIECTPPYKKDILDSCWVKYRKGERPTTKQGWEDIIGMELLPLTK